MSAAPIENFNQRAHDVNTVRGVEGLLEFSEEKVIVPPQPVHKANQVLKLTVAPRESSNKPPTALQSHITHPDCPSQNRNHYPDCPEQSGNLRYHPVGSPSQQDTTALVDVTIVSGASTHSSNFLRDSITSSKKRFMAAEDTLKPRQLLREASTIKSKNLDSHSDHGGNFSSISIMVSSCCQTSIMTAQRGIVQQCSDNITPQRTALFENFTASSVKTIGRDEQKEVCVCVMTNVCC